MDHASNTQMITAPPSPLWMDSDVLMTDSPPPPQYAVNPNDLWRPISPSMSPKDSKDLRDVSNQCAVCKLVFNDAFDLDRHHEDYARRQQHQCCQCDKRFASMAKLHAHHRKHSKEKPFRCNICGKFYTHKTTLVRHQMHYCQTLRAKCEDAASILTLPSLLHQNRHDDSFRMPMEPTAGPLVEKQQPQQRLLLPLLLARCKICDQDFQDPLSLQNHMDVHMHAKTCCKCKKVMGNKSKLVTHHRSHTKESPYECTFCGKKFSENSTLRKHEATHGARNFQCPECDRGFVRKDYLAKHMMTHKRTFKCATCHFVCHHPDEIQTHIQIHIQLQQSEI